MCVGKVACTEGLGAADSQPSGYLQDQAPANAILAYHERGTFHDIRTIDMRGRVAEWERMNKANVARFEKLLQKILSIARGREDGRLEIICEEGDKFLQIRRQALDVGATLSASTEQRWREWLDHGEEE